MLFKGELQIDADDTGDKLGFTTQFHCKGILRTSHRKCGHMTTGLERITMNHHHLELSLGIMGSPTTDSQDEKSPNTTRQVVPNCHQ